MVIQDATTAKKKVIMDEERSSGVDRTEQLGLINRLTTDPPHKTNTPHVSDGTMTPGLLPNQVANVFGTYY